MAFVLERDTTLAAEYVGKIGATVKLKVKGDKGNAKFVSGAFNSTVMPKAEFVIGKGVKDLSIIVHNDIELDWTGVYQVAGGEEKVLRSEFKFESKWPAVGFKIRGE